MVTSRIRIRKAIATVVASMTALAAGCAGAPPAEWHQTEAFARPRKEILDTMAEVLARKGFQIEKRDDAGGVILSKWQVRLQPHWRQGRRERVEMRLEAADGGFVVRVQAPVELNDNGEKPLSESEASWISGGGDEDLAAGIAYALKLKIKGIGLDE